MHDIAHAAADAADVPDFADVLARGERRRKVRHGIVAGAATLAVATIIGATQVIGGPDGTPEPGPVETPTAPSGSAPTTLPYWVDGELHVDGRVIATDLASSTHAAGTTVVGSAKPEGPSEYHLVAGDSLAPIARSDRLVTMNLSRDGEVVVLVEHVSEDVGRLVAWDVASRSEIASVDVPVDVQCCDAAGELRVVGIDHDHRVFLTDDRLVLMWVPGADPLRVTGVEPTVLLSKPWPGGLMLQRTVDPVTPVGVFGTVDDRGAFHEVGTTSNDQRGLWSPDGEVYATYGAPVGELSIEHADGREPDPIDLPGPGFWVPVGWESETELVLAVRGGQDRAAEAPPTEDLARCDVVALTCDRIEDIPAGAVAWSTDAGD